MGIIHSGGPIYGVNGCRGNSQKRGHEDVYQFELTSGSFHMSVESQLSWHHSVPFEARGNCTPDQSLPSTSPLYSFCRPEVSSQ